MINVSVVNKSTVFSDTALISLASALQIQVTRDLFLSYGVSAKMWYTPTGMNPHPDHWALFIMDDATQAGELGVHDVTPQGLPLAQAFAKTSAADGSPVERTASHENCEMLIDSMASLCAQIGSILYAYEVCDPPEADAAGYTITIPAGWTGAGTIVPVSNFVTPNWFQPGSAGPFDHLGLIKNPLELLPGGYISFLDLNNLRLGWQQKTARMDDAARFRARPHTGSRRKLRTIDIADRIRSTYSPGTEAIAAEAA